MDNTDKARISKLEERVDKLEKVLSLYHTTSSNTKSMKKISPKEFLTNYEVATNTDRALILGYYMEQIEGSATFNATDIDKLFRLSKEKPPKNMNDILAKNVARNGGLLMVADEKKDDKKAWMVTRTGEEYLNELYKNN